MCALVICESRNIILASIQQTDSNNHTIALTFCSTPHHGTKRLRISQNILLYDSYFTLNFTAGSSIGQGKIEAITHFLPAPCTASPMWRIEQNGPWLDKFHAENPDICLGISEYGCEGIINWHSNTPSARTTLRSIRHCTTSIWRRPLNTVLGSGQDMSGICSTSAALPAARAA